MSAPLRPRATAAPLVFPRTLAVGVLGAGRVGAVLGAALAAAGHRVVAASGASGATRARTALLLPQTPHRTASEVARAATDLLIVAVPDDALAGVVADLAASGALRPARWWRTRPARTGSPRWPRPSRRAPGRSRCTRR